MKRDARFVLISLLIVAALTLVSFGQDTTGTLEIITKNKTGSIVPGVTVTITCIAPKAGYFKTVTTDESGFIRVTGVPVGWYSLSASAINDLEAITIFFVQVKPGQPTPVSFKMPPVVVSGGNKPNIKTRTYTLPFPKGLNFSSILTLAPAFRIEPLSGQFQNEGASGSENTFFIDGQEVTNVISGRLDANNDLPFSLIEEIQVKTSGLEAEFAATTGSLVNVTTKAGKNDFHGEFGLSLRTSILEPVTGSELRSNNGTLENYPSRRDRYNETNPSANLGGPIIMDKLWFFATYAPQVFTQSRTLVFLDGNRVPTGRVETYNFKQRKEAIFLRVNSWAFSKLELNGTINWNPITQTGITPAFSSELNQTFATSSAYIPTGGRQNSMNFSMHGRYIPTSALVITAHVGHTFLNEKLGTYGIPGKTPHPALAKTEFNVTTRDQSHADAEYSFHGGGSHEVKGSYQYNRVGNKVREGISDLIRLSTFRIRGDVSSANQAVYIQDNWRVNARLNLSIGVRTEKEEIPSYASGLSGIRFGWGSKVALRLGAALTLRMTAKQKSPHFTAFIMTG